MGHVTGRFLVKFIEDPTVILCTYDTTFTLCSGRLHHFFKFKWTARILRRCTYELNTLSQLSWQPNPILILRCFVRNVSLFWIACNFVAIRISSRIKCEGLQLWHLCYSTMSFWSRTLGKEEGLFTCRTMHVVSCVSVR